MATVFKGAVKLTATKGYIEVVRADAVDGGTEFDAANAGEIAKAALGHAKALKLKIKAFVPDVEPSEKGPKGEMLFAPAKLEKLVQQPVILKAEARPLPYLAFLTGRQTRPATAKPTGLGEAAKAKVETPKGL